MHGVGEEVDIVGIGGGKLRGTGGTALLPFLNETRDETLRTGVV